MALNIQQLLSIYIFATLYGNRPSFFHFLHQQILPLHPHRHPKRNRWCYAKKQQKYVYIIERKVRGVVGGLELEHAIEYPHSLLLYNVDQHNAREYSAAT